MDKYIHTEVQAGCVFPDGYIHTYILSDVYATSDGRGPVTDDLGQAQHRTTFAAIPPPGLLAAVCCFYYQLEPIMGGIETQQNTKTPSPQSKSQIQARWTPANALPRKRTALFSKQHVQLEHPHCGPQGRAHQDELPLILLEDGVEHAFEL